MIEKLLIANRGEIAVRIIRTCKRLGIKTVAIFSDVDGASLHVALADEALPIGGKTPAESYLDIEKVIRTAKTSGCDAVHPGYGFLAENSTFIRAAENEGVTFVGPGSASVAQLENKILARKTMGHVGIPTIPGAIEPLKDEAEASRLAKQLGFPVLLKAVFGGGGRGMRIIGSQDELPRFFKIAQSEAGSAFGKPELYIEKLLPAARHVEVQVVCDNYGSAVHLGERECSIQRRHQKLMEEAPSPSISESIRQRMCELAVRGLLAAGYTNTGTVEYLVDSSSNFYFLEVNKRLQVEHLVTEMVTGIDIVEQQLLIASGEKLGLSQEAILPRGVAIDCRINAEDPFHGFTPTPGTVTRLRLPSGPGVRVDTALYDGFLVPEYYDSLIAKLACWGKTRVEAIARLKVALQEFQIEGVSTTVPYHQAIINDPNFLAGRFDTEFSPQDWPRQKIETHLSILEVGVVAALVGLEMAVFQLKGRSEVSRGNDQSRWRTAARAEALSSRALRGSRFLERH